jgi:hypothetical protein
MTPLPAETAIVLERPDAPPATTRRAALGSSGRQAMKPRMAAHAESYEKIAVVISGPPVMNREPLPAPAYPATMVIALERSVPLTAEARARAGVRIPGDGDSDSELMPIRIPN